MGPRGGAGLSGGVGDRPLRPGQHNKSLNFRSWDKAKHVALRRLYDGLRAITLLVSLTAALFAYLVGV
jgi:hypothetical protein